MERIRLIGRGSRLSVLQMEKVAGKIESVLPSVKVEIITRTSKGDALQDIPLHTVEGSDFFTQDIFDALAANEADIAVRNLIHGPEIHSSTVQPAENGGPRWGSEIGQRRSVNHAAHTDGVPKRAATTGIIDE